MEMYGRNPPRIGSKSEPPEEWSTVGAETGLEEPMWQLELQNRESYPERPGAFDCAYYMRTGICGFGSRCRYNHPRDRSRVMTDVSYGGVEYPERVGEPVCQYYLKTGTCKFGPSCKFHHPSLEGGSMGHVPLNYNGYPLRPGEQECSYYLKTGQCKFGRTCKFHHPQPTGLSISVPPPALYPAVQSPSVPSSEQYVGPSASWRATRPPLLASSYVQGAYGPVLFPPGVVPIPSWNYSATVSQVVSPGAQPTVGGGSSYGVSSPMPAFAGPFSTLPSSTGPLSSSQKDFPDRPGQLECQYYLKTGDCKFGSSCKYHHPPEWALPKTNCVLSPLGLPLRQGVQPCSFYLQNGYCKFGPVCKFDHPVGAIKYSPSASSLTDMPVAPYPIGRSLASMAPSSSSLDLRPRFVSGPNRDFSNPVGVRFSQTRSVSLSEAQLSGQDSAPLNSSRSTSQGSEFRRSRSS